MLILIAMALALVALIIALSTSLSRRTKYTITALVGILIIALLWHALTP